MTGRGSLLSSIFSLAVVCQASSGSQSAESSSSFVCPHLSRHVEVWDQLPGAAGFKTRWVHTNHVQKLRKHLPAGCKEHQEEMTRSHDGVAPRSLLQVGLKVSKIRLHEEEDRLISGRPALVPYPKSVRQLDSSSGSFALTKSTTISLGSGVSEDADFVAASVGDLRKRISDATAALPHSLPGGGDASSLISLNMAEQSGADPESYKLTIQKDKILLEANGPAGFSHGVTTLQQLIPFAIDRSTSLAQTASGGTTNSGVLSAMVIEDGPAFKYRGVHLDVSRHFFPSSDVKKLLNTMAAFKLNRFHWHLTDDQGWRFPVPQYPELTKKGAGPRFKGNVQMSSGEGIEGSYTEQDIRDVVAYAKARHIEVIPEVDVPGHVAAAIAAYPELGNKDYEAPAGPQHEFGVHKWTLAPTKKSADFLEAVFGEVARLFPDSEYIHLGGDEAPQDQWRHASHEAKKGWESFEGANAQSYFNKKVSDIIRSKGKKMAGWDEVQAMDGLPQDAAIFAWRGENELRKALANHRQAINSDCNHLYLDHYQGPESTEPKAIGGPLTTAKNVYEYDPVPSWVSDKDKPLVLGSQAQLWSEYFPNWKQVEYMAWPRVIALAERLWTPEEELSYPDFKNRLGKRVEDLDHWGVNYHALDN